MSKSRSRRVSPLATAVRKFFVSGFVVLSFVAYAVHDRLVNADASSVDLAPSAGGAQTQLLASSPQPLPTSRPIVPISQQIISTSPANLPATDVPQVASPTVFIPTNTFIAPTDTPVPPTMTPQSQGQYRDGTYSGPSVDAFYGQVQVQVTVQGGKLTNVQFLDYPHDRRTSQEINSQADPWLIQEAIQAQSANIDIISGATLSSQAFIQSLNTVLNQVAN